MLSVIPAVAFPVNDIILAVPLSSHKLPTCNVVNYQHNVNEIDPQIKPSRTNLNLAIIALHLSKALIQVSCLPTCLRHGVEISFGRNSDRAAHGFDPLPFRYGSCLDFLHRETLSTFDQVCCFASIINSCCRQSLQFYSHDNLAFWFRFWSATFTIFLYFL